MHFTDQISSWSIGWMTDMQLEGVNIRSIVGKNKYEYKLSFSRGVKFHVFSNLLGT